MKVWSDLVYKTAIAKTKGTFDAINSNQNSVIIRKKDAITIIGFLIGYCASKLTDAENIPDLFVRINNKALGISNEIVAVLNGGPDADANTDYTPMITAFVPFKIRPDVPREKVFNSAFTFEASPSITSTEGLDVVVAVLHANGEPDMAFVMELLAQMHGRVTGGDAQGDAAKAHGTGGAAVTLTSLSIPAGTKQLRALGAAINPNGITATDPISGFMEFIAPGIPDFSPQLWPLSKFQNPALGTVADSSVATGRGRLWPTRFPLTGAEVTITVQSTLIVAAGTAPDTTQTVLYE
jgi:hypothetical protein